MPKAKSFTVCLQLGSAHYTSTGTTIIDALGHIKPTQIKSRGVFVVTKDGKHAQQMMLVPMLKRLLINKTFQQIFEKRMLTTLK